MNKKDDIRNCEDGMERQGPTQALPKGYPSFTQGLGLLKSMARVWLEYAYSMARVCLKHAYATSMLRRCYADATPMLRLQYAKSMSGVCQESVSCERPVRHLRTLSPSRANTQSASFGQYLRFTLLFVMMMLGSVGVKAADYVFTYNGGYLAVNNSGNVTYSTDVSRSCIWTCVSSTTELTEVELDGNTSYYLYTKVGDSKYWLVSNTTNGNRIIVSTTVPTAARWRGYNGRLRYTENGTNSFYVYYRGSLWRTSSTRGNSDNDYRSNNNNGTDYRSTTTNLSVASPTTTVSVPTIEPSSSSLDYGSSQTFTASATADVTPSYKTFTVSGTTYYYYNNTIYSTEAAMKASSGWTSAITHPDPTYSWALTGAASDYLTPTSGTGESITIEHNTSHTSDANSTLTVTAEANGVSKVATATITAKGLADPTSVSITSASPIALSVGKTATITYTLLPDLCYNNVTFASSNNDIATVDVSSGVVTGVAVGTATITLSAKNSSGAVTATATVDVTVMPAAETPTFSFDNSTNKVTISSATSGATIYYTTDGTDPTTSSDVYSEPFVQNDATTIKAIAVKDGMANSEVGTYELVKLARPFMSFTVSGSTATATFESEDDGVTFYYNSYNVDASAPDPGVPTSSSSSWTTGNANPTFAANHLVKLITMKAATATTGYITSDVFTRRANATDMSNRNYVFFYDDGTNVNFMANNGGMITNTTTFNPSTVIWEGLPFANGAESMQTLLGGGLYYEPFIRFRNNGQYLGIWPRGVEEPSQFGVGELTTTLTPTDSMYFYQRKISQSTGTVVNLAYFFNNPGYGVYAINLAYNSNTKKWIRFNWQGNIGFSISDNDPPQYQYTYVYQQVTYPVEERGGGGYSLTTTCPDDGAGGYKSLKKGESTTFTASTTGTYNPVYYRVGNEAKYFYYYPNTSTPMTDEPTGTNDIRITYELVNGQGYCELVGNKVTLLYDPGVDRLVSVRITATPYINDVAQTEAIQEEYCYFHILTNPPFPAPVINRVEGTNQYEITCTAANSEIEYRIGDETEWHTYSTPITVVAPGTVIMARSYRDRGGANYELSDPVTYTVGGASLLIPTVTIAENGGVTITANANNNTSNLGDYIGEDWLYTLDGSDPDPSHVGDANPTQMYNASTGVTLTNGQSIRVIAVDKNDPEVYGHSAVAVAHYKVNSGADANNSGIITLNDYEDHEWSYYQASDDLPTGYPDQLHSPYPRNVKITYYGYGENTLSTSAEAAPAADSFNTKTTQGDVKVGIDEPGHTFIYYKTLERDANGRYPYQLIPNPFYVRPDVRDYSGNKEVTFTLNDAGGDGWGASYLKIDYSTPVNGHSTENIEFKESQGSKTVPKTIPTGVTFTLTWHAGGGQSDECSFTVSGYDNNSSTYSSGTGLQSGPLTAIKVHGTESVSTYTGFYKWRIKSIGTGNIYTASSGGNALAVGAMLDAETTYYFDPLDNGTTNVHNAESMTIELEALWAPADVGNNSHGYGSVERTFYVTSGGSTTSLNAYNHPCTHSSFYPNGTTDGTTVATLNNRKTNRASYTASAATKIEYIILNNYYNDEINAAGNNLIYGRGVTANGTYCATSFYGRNSDATNLNYTLRLESGVFKNFYLTGNSRTYSGVVSAKCVFGSDYDRAKEDNSKLSIAANEGDIYGGSALTFSSNGNRNNLTFDWMLKSGSFHSGITGNAAGGTQTIYLGSSQATGGNLRYIGKRRIIVEGGNLAGIAGAMNNQSTSYGVNDGGWAVMMRIKGGTMRTSLYGAAAFAQAVGDRVIVCTGGTVNGWIAGGCNGTQTGSGGTVDGDTKIYVGGLTQVVHANTDPTIGTSKGGNVFGAGSGYSDQYAIGEVHNSNVVLADDAVVSRGVYGGGNYGYVGSGYSSNLFILGGTANQVFGGSNQRYGQTVNIYMDGGLVKSGLYGGSNVSGNINNNVTIQINGGQIGESANNTGNVHGGGLGNATRVLGSVNMTIGESVGATKYVTVYGDVYGGSAQGKTNGDTQRRNNAVTNVTLNAGKIHGSLYGGGLGTSGTGGYAADVYGPVQVTVNGGGVHATSNMGSGAVYGCNNVNGAPLSTVKVDIYGTDAPADGRKYALDAVYGGGNQAGYTGSPEVTVHNCDNSIEYVYGGGNAADITGNTTVTIWGGNEIGTVFGGGHGDRYSDPQYEANVSGDVSVNIYGGTIGQVFGGSNSKGTIGGTISVDISRNQEAGKERCKMHIGEVYGGGNEADSNAGSIHIGCTGDMADDEGIGDVYGGANKANVNGDITLDIEGGNINRVFGGNNSSGNISGKITVDIDWNSSYACRSYYLGSVFGGGNLAAYTAPANSPNYPEVNIKNTKGGNTTVSGNVFGAGMGDEVDGTKGVVTGNPVVNIIGGKIGSDVYGGGSYASVEGSTSVNLVGGSIAHNVYGGGLGSELSAAMVKGNATVLLNGGTSITGATNDCEVKGTIFGCNNVNGSPTGHVLVHVYKTVAKNDNGSLKDKPDKTTEVTDATPGTYEMAAVYGGGNLAAYEPADGETKPYTEVIIDGCNLTSIGYVYGGGNAASVPATNVTVNGTHEIGWLFGGGNGKDEIAPGVPNPGANVGYKADGTTAYGPGTSTVNINGGTVHKAFGGSNTLGNVRESAIVNLDEKKEGGTAICPLKVDEVYGGGNEAFMAGGGEIILGCITYMKEIYGGARNADVGSDVSLTITSGHFDRVFGGNNQGGKIKGSIKVNIEETGCNPITIGELYGCGNAAAYSVHDKENGRSADPELNIKSFTSIGRVFGGGLGASATVTGNPTVNIDEIVGANASETSSYAGTTRTLPGGSTVTLPTHASGKIGAIGTVFGGGNAAPVKGNTNVNIGTQESVTYVSGDKSTNPVEGVDIREDVFGGGLGSTATVSGNTNVKIGR